MPVLMYGSETMLWREKEKSRIRAVQREGIMVEETVVVDTMEE